MSVTFSYPSCIDPFENGVNMHNTGARQVLDALGLSDPEGYLCGSEVATVFGTKLLEVAYEVNSELRERLMRLAPVVAEAASRGEEIRWS